jgi:hypothetical protein
LQSWAYVVAGVTSWLFVGAWWFLLWRKSVRWTGARMTYTFAFAALALLVSAAVRLLIRGLIDRDFASFLGSVTAPLLWLVSTIFVWQESPAERAERVARATGGAVACPTCGYNLTGLREARCPECGSQFTVDQLLAAQRASHGGGGGELDG